jgi:hypothetical protein
MTSRREILIGARKDLENLKRTFEEANQEWVTRGWGAVGLFREFFPTFMDSKETLHRTSAFWIYYMDSVQLAQRAWADALCFYYGIGHSLLRSALESLVRGAFWEGMAHIRFRGDAQVIGRTGTKIGKEKKTLLDWFADVFKLNPNAEHEFEQMSGAIFDRTSPLFVNRGLSRVVPSFKQMLEQVVAWGLLKPMEEPLLAVHDHLYWELSKDAHLIPDKTLLGRRFIAGKGPSPLMEFNSEELESFIEALRCVVDVGILLSINLAKSTTVHGGGVPAKLAALREKVQKLLSDLYAARLFID